LCECCSQDFGEHGREFISSEVGLRLLQVLADPQLLQNYTGQGKRLERLNAILEQTVLKVRWKNIFAIVRQLMVMILCLLPPCVC
jgi:hypothetical protein